MASGGYEGRFHRVFDGGRSVCEFLLTDVFVQCLSLDPGRYNVRVLEA